MANIDFWLLLQKTQEYLSRNYAAALTDRDKSGQLKNYIDKYLRDNSYRVDGMDTKTLIDRLYREMAEYSILTPFLGSSELEEINVNGWDDIALTYLDGSIRKLDEHFHSPQHAVDVIKRLLHHSGMVIDNATPIAQGHLPGNTRITALKTPIVDDERGVAVSIRLLHPQRVDINNLVETGFATEEMVAFLCMCIRYGVPFVVAGATSSGKTTFLNAIMSSIPDSKRVFTIESGSREFSLIHRDNNGNVINNIVNTLSRPSDNPAYDITQEDLVVASLRFDPDIVCVGEMRDTEAYSAVEASLTGHTVVSTVHSGPAGAAHLRIALLCQKRFPIDFDTSLTQAAQAFPVVVYAHKLENNERRCMDISECVIKQSGHREYNCLYSYQITKNTSENGKLTVEGHFRKPNFMSDSLKQRLIRYGVPQDLLDRFFRKESVG